MSLRTQWQLGACLILGVLLAAPCTLLAATDDSQQTETTEPAEADSEQSENDVESEGVSSKASSASVEPTSENESSDDADASIENESAVGEGASETAPTTDESEGSEVGVSDSDTASTSTEQAESRPPQSEPKTDVAEMNAPSDSASSTTQAPETTLPTATVPAQTLASLGRRKSGLWGWGLGLEVPLGVLAGTPEKSSHGVGYTMGLALSFELLRGWSLRLGLTGGETSRGNATIQYLEGGIPLEKSFEAEWLGVELGFGLQYMDKDFDDLLWPYLGVEAGPTFAGYYYRFDSATVSTLATNDETTRYGANEYEAVGLGWAARLRGGVRVELTPGMEWGTEYSLSMTTVSENEPVTNTRQIREVFPIQEFVFQHRLVISLWLGL